MEIEKIQNGDVTTLNLTGRLDTVTSPDLQKTLVEIMPGTHVIELNFSKVDYVSSAGLRVLLFGQKNTQASGKTMKLKNVSTEVSEVFKITGFDGMLIIE